MTDLEIMQEVYPLGFNWIPLDLTDPELLEALDGQQGTGHPSAYVPGFRPTYNTLIDDTDMGLREYIQKNHLTDFPSDMDPDDTNGSDFATDLGAVNIVPGINFQDIEAEANFFWGGQCEYSKRVKMRGSYVAYQCTWEYVGKDASGNKVTQIHTAKEVCFQVNPESIVVTDVPLGEYELVPRGINIDFDDCPETSSDVCPFKKE